MADQSIPTGAATPLTTNVFQKEGYVFAGWTTQQDGTGTKYTDGQQ